MQPFLVQCLPQVNSLHQTRLSQPCLLPDLLDALLPDLLPGLTDDLLPDLPDALPQAPPGSRCFSRIPNRARSSYPVRIVLSSQV